MPKKIFFSFAISAFLIAGITIFTPAVQSDFHLSVIIFLLVTIFMTLFIIIFFLLNIKKTPSVIETDFFPEQPTLSVSTELINNHDDPDIEYFEIDDFEIAEDLSTQDSIPCKTDVYGSGLLSAALNFADDNDDPVTLENIGSMEDISFASMFSSAITKNNTQVTRESANHAVTAEVIIEQDGIPYIDSSAVKKNTESEINSNFIKLVDSVIRGDPAPNH